MDWTQVLTIILSNLGILLVLFVYLMSRMDSNKKDLEQKISEDIRDLKSDINQRLTDTNQRLSDFRTDVNQRLSTIEGYLVPRKVFRFEEPDHKEEPKEN